MNETPYSVSDITDHIESLFANDELLTDLWIEGEVLETFQSRAGHIYFSVGDESAKLKCVMFRNAAIRQRTLPRVGDACSLHGSISIYAKEGSYQYYVDFVRPAGFGLAALEFQLLRQRLEAEGLFDTARKRPIPAFPATIGLVTSAEGAVLHDIRTVLQRRNPFVRVLVSPTAVQGESAPESLRAALALLLQSGSCDVIIIARGGGSVTDLAVFNHELLVRDVFASSIPVVSAVGHETDWTLVDEVADLRAPTPSAAAELCSLDLWHHLAEWSTQLESQRRRTFRGIDTALIEVSQARDRASEAITGRVRNEQYRTSSLDHQLIRSGERLLTGFEQPADALTLHMNAVMKLRFTDYEKDVLRLGTTLEALSPTRILQRGYAVVQDQQTRRQVRSAHLTTSNQRIDIRFADGVVSAEID